MKNQFAVRAKRLVALMTVVTVGAMLPACVSTSDAESAESTGAAAAVSAEETPTSNAAISQALAGSNNIVAEGAAPSTDPVVDGNADGGATEAKTEVPPTVGNATEVPTDTTAVPLTEGNASAASTDAVSADPFAPVANNTQPVETAVTAVPANAPAAPVDVAAAPVDVAVAPVDVAAAPVDVAAAPVASESVPAPTQTVENVEAAPVATASAVPENGTLMPYVVKDGDTLASIAKKIFGKSERWQELAKVNNIKNPNLIYSGDVLLFSLDSHAKNFAEKYPTTGKKIVKVVSGDSLWSIAAREFGEGAAWRVLVKNNPKITNPDRISIGMNLIVPTGLYIAAK
jgi:nucleoid-associated protein YgaU